MNQQRVEEQEIRDLIAGAGRREGVPEQEVTRIKEAARVEWRAMVADERRRLRGARARLGLTLAAGVILAVSAGWWWASRPAPVGPPVVAAVERVLGSVRGGGVEMAVGGELVAGTRVGTPDWTPGSPGGAALRLAGGQSLRLAPGSEVRLLTARSVELRRGTLYIDSDAGAAAAGVEVITELGTVRDVGTQFEVRLGEGGAALRVRVREGEVSLEADGDRHAAERGDQLSRLVDGSVVRARVEPYGSEWEWVMATAPGIDVEGRALAEILAWVERETGREIRYAEPSLAEEARQITVSGPAVGLTPTQTLDTVLRISGLRHRVENGTLLILR